MHLLSFKAHWVALDKSFSSLTTQRVVMRVSSYSAFFKGIEVYKTKIYGLSEECLWDRGLPTPQPLMRGSFLTHGWQKCTLSQLGAFWFIHWNRPILFSLLKWTVTWLYELFHWVEAVSNTVANTGLQETVWQQNPSLWIITICSQPSWSWLQNDKQSITCWLSWEYRELSPLIGKVMDYKDILFSEQ